MFFFNIQGTTQNVKWSDYIPQSSEEYNLNIEFHHEILQEILKLNIVLNFDKDSMEFNHYNKLNTTYTFNQKYKEIKINSNIIDITAFIKNTTNNIISFFSNLMKFYHLRL